MMIYGCLLRHTRGEISDEFAASEIAQLKIARDERALQTYCERPRVCSEKANRGMLLGAMRKSGTIQIVVPLRCGVARGLVRFRLVAIEHLSAPHLNSRVHVIRAPRARVFISVFCSRIRYWIAGDNIIVNNRTVRARFDYAASSELRCVRRFEEYDAVRFWQLKIIIDDDEYNTLTV